MNINMLRDTDDDPGFYAAVSSADVKWPGCTLFKSTDSGATYQQVASISTAATMGRVVSTLAGFEGGNIPDELNSIRVVMTHGTLSSVPYAAFLNGVQAAIVGDEIIGFRDAVLNADGTYTVSGLLRGMRGSEYAMGDHSPGERFVLADLSLQRIPGVTADLHVARLYKAVTSGGSLATTGAQTFANDGAELKPYAPAQVGGGRNAAGDVLITWTRRTRISGEWRPYVDVPLGEVSEAYEVEIMDASYTTVKRTLTGLSSPVAIYSAADQVTDFGSAQATVYLRVFQLSAVIGRGYEARATI